MNKLLYCVICLLLLCTAAQQAETPRPLRSPENQVFQFAFSATRSDWPNGKPTSATAYLWIPEHSRKLRGLLIFGTNVPEHMMVGSVEIRAVAAANDLGIVFSTPSFYNFQVKNQDVLQVAFLQDLLRGLALRSGYAEVATVPWLPVGESGHLLMVDALVEAAPERCIAGIWLKNPHLPPHNRTVPALVIFGSAQEWGQDKADIDKRWNDTAHYATVLRERSNNPEWALTYVFDGGSGHFDVSDKILNYTAHYIDAVVKARVPMDGSGTLRRIDLATGFLAGLPLPGQAEVPVSPYAKAPAEGLGLPWYFDAASAEEAQAIGRINWKAETQLPGFTDAAGKVAAFDFNGISSIVPQMEADGITFTVHPVSLDKRPENFLEAGKLVAKGQVSPKIEWLCGAVKPLGGDKFQVAMDRTYRQQAIYLAGRVPGTDKVREAVQPVAIKLQANGEGTPQKIAFEHIGDVKLGTRYVPLHATSDSGLPVRYFVVAGPAIIRDAKVVLTEVPPGTKFPVSVTVAAWQWGRDTVPQIKAAATERETFLIVR